MTRQPGIAHHVDASLHPEPARVIARMFSPSELADGRTRADGIVRRVMALPEDEIEHLAAALVADFSSRHRRYTELLSEHATAALGHSPDATTSAARVVVLGACFTAEYATEAAALCNPSAVLHPDQDGLAPGQARLAVSLRGIGEGHLSSIGFTSAVVGPGPQWSFAPRSIPAVLGTRTSTAAALPTSMYEVTFPAEVALGQRVLFPSSSEESHGMEDARFVRFLDPDGRVEYRATYTAYDGQQIAPRLLTTPDLRTFQAHRLDGPAAHNKGMALFPRLIGGRHLALCRVDGESNWLSSSPDGFWWNEPHRIEVPEQAWKLLQIGNCGPPIEIEQGWLVLTHGVGPMRVYSIGAILLDRDDPAVVLGRLERPLLQVEPRERDGYVPNVAYSCGGVVHDGRVWIPYGVADMRIAVAWASVDELVGEMILR